MLISGTMIVDRTDGCGINVMSSHRVGTGEATAVGMIMH